VQHEKTLSYFSLIYHLHSELMPPAKQLKRWVLVQLQSVFVCLTFVGRGDVGEGGAQCCQMRRQDWAGGARCIVSVPSLQWKLGRVGDFARVWNLKRYMVEVFRGDVGVLRFPCYFLDFYI